METKINSDGDIPPTSEAYEGDIPLATEQYYLEEECPLSLFLNNMLLLE
jgi:hypothetical protein